MDHHAQLIFVFLEETGFHHVGKTSLKLWTSVHPPTLASQSAGIIGVSQCTWLDFFKCPFVVIPASSPGYHGRLSCCVPYGPLLIIVSQIFLNFL